MIVQVWAVEGAFLHWLVNALPIDQSDHVRLIFETRTFALNRALDAYCPGAVAAVVKEKDCDRERADRDAAEISPAVLSLTYISEYLLPS